MESKTFRCYLEGRGITIPPRFIIRIHMEPSEVPFGMVKFELKARRHDLFESWATRILAMERFLKHLGILRSINLARFMEVERNQVDLHSSCRGGRPAPVLPLLLEENSACRWRMWRC